MYIFVCAFLLVGSLSTVLSQGPPVPVTCGLSVPSVCTFQLTYPDPETCEGYYECDEPFGHAPVWHSCGVGFLYDCCQPVGCHPIIDTLCNKCIGYFPTDEPTGEPLSTTQGPIQPPPDKCYWEGDLIPDPNDCQSYWSCQTSYPVPIQQYCPSGYYFDVCNLNCRPASVVACSNPGGYRPPYTSVCTGYPECTQSGDVYADPYNCSGYFECNYYGYLQHLYCPSTYSFELGNNACEPHEIVDCDEATGTRPRPTSPPTAPPSVECLFAGEFIPDPTNCQWFYECDTGLKPVWETCPDNLEFDVYTKSCKGPLEVDCDGGVRPPMTLRPRIPKL